MQENKKKITSGDILEMMVRAGIAPEKDAYEGRKETRNPIISINGKDVQWHELDRGKKDKAA